MRIAVIYLSLLPLVLTGCSRNPHPVAPPRIAITDTALLLSRASRQSLSNLGSAATGADVYLAVLTVPDIVVGKAPYYADTAWKGFPAYKGIAPEKLAISDLPVKVRDIWSPRSILILVSRNDRMLQVRLGPQLGDKITNQRVGALLAKRVYPLIDRRMLRVATTTAARLLIQEAQANAPPRGRQSALRDFAASGAFALRSATFPSWDSYYIAAYRPMLNALAVLQKVSRGSPWSVLVALGIVVWLFRRNAVSGVLGWLLQQLWRRSSCLWSPLSRRYGPAQVIEVPIALLTGLGALAITAGMGFPLMAAITTLADPLREHQAMLKVHCYPWLRHWLLGGQMPTIQGPLFGYTSLDTSAGWLAGLLVALAGALTRGAEILTAYWASNMSDEERRSSAISESEATLCHLRVNAQPEKALLYPLTVGAAVAVLPWLSGAYFTLSLLADSVGAGRQARRRYLRLTRDSSQIARWLGKDEKSEAEALLLAWQDMARGQMESSANRLQVLAHTRPADWGLALLRGLVLGRLGRYDESESELRYAARVSGKISLQGTVFDTDRQLRQIQLLRCLDMSANGQKKQALRRVERILSRNPGCAETAYTKGLLLLGANQSDEGMKLLETAARADPSSSFILALRQVRDGSAVPVSKR